MNSIPTSQTSDRVFYTPLNAFVTQQQADILDDLVPVAPSVAAFAENILEILRAEFRPSADTIADIRGGGHPLYVSAGDNATINRKIAAVLVECLERQWLHDNDSEDEKPSAPDKESPASEDAPLWYRRMVAIFDSLASRYRNDPGAFAHLTDSVGCPVEDYGYLMTELFVHEQQALDAAGKLPTPEKVCGTPVVAAQKATTKETKPEGEPDRLGSAGCITLASLTAVLAADACLERLASVEKGKSLRDLAIILLSVFDGQDEIAVASALEVLQEQELASVLQDAAKVVAGDVDPILNQWVFHLALSATGTAVIRKTSLTRPGLEFSRRNAKRLNRLFGGRTVIPYWEAVYNLGSRTAVCSAHQFECAVKAGQDAPLCEGVVFRVTPRGVRRIRL